MTRKQTQKILNILKEVFHRSVSKDYRVNNPMTEFSIPDSYFVREYDKDVEESVLNSFEFNFYKRNFFEKLKIFQNIQLLSPSYWMLILVLVLAR